jgi:hypothetical protein
VILLDFGEGRVVTTDDVYIGVQQPNGDEHYHIAYIETPDGELLRQPDIADRWYDRGQHAVRWAGELHVVRFTAKGKPRPVRVRVLDTPLAQVLRNALDRARG